MYWHQGFSRAPRVISKCVETWRIHNPDWELHLLDGESISQFVSPPDIPKNKLTRLKLAHQSDLIRTQLLIKYGGVWADPTCYCVTGLDSWLHTCMSGGLLMFSHPGRDRIISNWFIAADPQNVFLMKLYDALCSYWSENDFSDRDHRKKMVGFVSSLINRRVETTTFWFSSFATKILRISPYMVYHYMFYLLSRKDAECKEVWQKMPKISAAGPHILKHHGLLNPLNDIVRGIIDTKRYPLFKLTWKIDEHHNRPDSVLSYLLDPAKRVV